VRAVRSIDQQSVDVWISKPDSIGDEALLLAYRGVLDEDERTRMGRLRFPEDRHTYLVAHALARSALSRYEDRDPAEWRFVSNEHGRPEIHPRHRSSLRFNLSHTRRVVACGVAIDRSIGVDVESAERRIDIEEVARQQFADDEYRALVALPEDRRRARFLEYWTLKEAYIKARGRGLDLPLDSFSLDLSEEEPITVSFDDRAGDDPAAWQFMQCWLSPSDSLAVAIPRRGNDLDVTIREVVPMAP